MCRAIELKIDTVKYEMARNYVTNDVLNSHIAGEETWHQHFNNELRELREDVREIRKMWLDFQKMIECSEETFFNVYRDKIS